MEAELAVIFEEMRYNPWLRVNRKKERCETRGQSMEMLKVALN